MTHHKNHQNGTDSQPQSQKNRVTYSVIAGVAMSILTSCGSDSGAKTVSLPDTTGSGSTTTTPINTIPTTGKTYIELGPIAGGSVEFQTLAGSLISKGGTADDGSLDYKPRDIIAGMGNDQWCIMYISGGRDIDKDDDGIIDAQSTPLYGSFQVLVPRSELESGGKIYATPRAGLITAMLLAQKNPNIDISILDRMSQESGAVDQNGDGIVNYRDILSTRAKEASGISKDIPAMSGFIPAIHSGDRVQKTKSLINTFKTENQMMTRIVLPDNSQDYFPSLEIKTTSPTATIYYTLDLSSPIPGASGTRSAIGKLTIPFQSAKIYYREQSSIDGELVLGKVAGFDLESDWTELATRDVTYSTNEGIATIPETFTYKNTDYTITTVTGSIATGYRYPKTITCQVGTKKETGCHQGPYIAWSPDQEARIRTLIQSAARDYIDNPIVIIPPGTDLIDIYRDAIAYKGATYTIKNTWTKGINNTKVFPVVIDVIVNRKSGKTYTTNRTVTTQSDLTSLNKDLEQAARDYIDNDTLLPGSTHVPNEITAYTEKVDPYYGGWYQVQNQWNIDGKGEFPVKIIGNYSLQLKGRQPNIELWAQNESERISKSNQVLTQIQNAIQADTVTLPGSNFSQNQLIDSGLVSYRGYGYHLLTTMNIDGNSDYPASVRVSYTTPLSSDNTTLSLRANSATELASVQVERINDAKVRIDLTLDADKHGPYEVETITNETNYAGGSYRTTFTYSGNIGQDYPGYVDVYIVYPDGTTDKIPITADNENQKNTYASNLEEQARTQIASHGPQYTVGQTTSDGPYSYGTKGGDYTIYAMYNRVGTGAAYPALIWIEFHERTGGILLDSRKIRAVGDKYANNEAEKNQIKQELENYVRGRGVASATFSETIQDTLLATNRILQDLSFFPAAYAATNGGMYVSPVSAQLSGFSFYSSDTRHGQFFSKNATVLDHFVRRDENKKMIASTKQDQLDLKNVIRNVQINAEKIKELQKNCYGTGSLAPTNGVSETCTPESQEQIRGHENAIYKQIGDYLKFGGGLSVGAGAAIYDEIMGIGSDVVELADGTTLIAFENNLGSLKAKISEYIVNGQIDYAKIKNSLVTGTSAIEKEIGTIITILPGALATLDVYTAGYYTGKIGGGIVLEFVNPVKKAKLLTKGFSAGRWLSTARYIIDASKAGHNGTKIKEIAEKLRYVNWSRVNKPDMGKITHPELVKQITRNYRDGASIGNGSTADAIRYTKTTGLLVGDVTPSDHLQKGQDTLNALKSRFNANDLTATERPIAQSVYDDIQAAMNGN